MSVHKIFKSKDNGEHYTELYSVRTNTWTSKLNVCNYYKGTYYMIIPGKGILRTMDLINFEEFWNNTELLSLFIDHNGVLIARDLRNQIFYSKEL